MYADFFFFFFSVFKVLLLKKQTSEYHLSKETKTMHIIQVVQEKHALYFGYAFFRRFRLILQESS